MRIKQLFWKYGGEGCTYTNDLDVAEGWLCFIIRVNANLKAQMIYESMILNGVEK